MKRRETGLFDTCPSKVGNHLPAPILSGSGRPLRLLPFLVSIPFLCGLPFPAQAAESCFSAAESGTGDILVPILLSLTVILTLLIAGLIIGICRQKSKLRKNHEYLVRYITNNLELKKQLSGLKEPYAFNPPEITPNEFIKIIDNMLKRILLLSLFTLFALPLAAHERADSAYTFRFVPGKATFYVPYRDNAPALDRLVRRLAADRKRLDGGYAYVSVTGYVSPGTDRAAALSMGYRRNSYVKSELILRAGLSERMFVTDRVIVGSTAEGVTNAVVVTFPAPVEKVERIAGRQAAERVLAFRQETRPSAEPQKAEPATEPRPAAPAETLPPSGRDAAESTAAPAPEAKPTAPTVGPRFSLRANLLRWATLTPDLGAEWRIDRNWSVLLNGSWTSWSWDDRNRRYALWEVAPEVRRYLGPSRRGYVGVLFKGGGFNYKLSDTGRQGDLLGGGITGGYRLPLGRALSLDFSAGIGCIHADYDRYAVIDRVQVRRGSEKKNWWGPVRAGVTLEWTLF